MPQNKTQKTASIFSMFFSPTEKTSPTTWICIFDAWEKNMNSQMMVKDGDGYGW